MDPQQQFCLKWNSFGNNLVTTFETLFKSESLTDVTLFCEGVTFKAHKIILAACSKHFQDLFEAAPFCPNILVILDGTSSGNMSALLEFMYKGEVHVSQESLSGFLKAAESLQIKGLSIEHQERLVSANNGRVSDMRVGGGSRTPTPSPSSMPPSLRVVSSDSGDTSEGMHPPSSTAYSSILSPYLSHYRGGSSTSSYDHPPPRKRHHRSPSDSNQRASVLRVGVPERESPLALTSSPQSHHEFNFHRSTAADREPDHLDSSNSSSTLPFASQAQESVAVESTPTPAPSNTSTSSPDWRCNNQEAPSNSCPEDLRIKTEPRSSNSSSGNHSSSTSEHNHRPSGGGDSASASIVNSSRPDTNHHEMNHLGDGETWRESNRDPAGCNAKQQADHGGTGVWNSTTGTGYQTSQEISNAHKSAIATTTPTGKKLQCPYCERLYGYETNLRAHIRQRHQGIRAPCPYCSRTFTRNNTVRRHIAREHKTELNLTAKAFQLSQVQNHNQ